MAEDNNQEKCQEQPSDFWDIKKVANFLGVTTRSVERFALEKDEAKRLMGLKLGNKWRFTEADVDDFIRRRRESTAREISEK